MPKVPTEKAAIFLLLGVIVPVPRIVTDKLVYVPVLDKVKALTFNVVDGTVNVVEPKSNLLNQLPVVNVCVAVVPLNVKLGALVVVPPVVPNVNVLVILAAAENPPVVPVQVNPVTVAISSTV